MKRAIEIGILQSAHGDYAALGLASRAGLLQGVAEVNADPSLDVTFTVVDRDPGCRIDQYAPMCRDILRQSGARHIFGCITSASRKEVIPELQRFDGILWYPVPYEGFEASERVAYTHSCPNQHLLPLLDWAMPNFGSRGYLIGSNYIWGWEISQIARERIQAAGGTVLGDRYVSIGDTDIDHILAEIAALKPDFILNSLVDQSCYKLMEGLAQLRAGWGDAAQPIPMLSCNFTECEIAIAGDVCEGLIAAGPYFENGTDGPGSMAEMARRSVHELAGLLNGNPGAEHLGMSDLLRIASERGYAPWLDPTHLHVPQKVIIAQIRDGRFVELQSSSEELRADPYLTGSDTPTQTPSPLQVVS